MLMINGTSKHETIIKHDTHLNSNHNDQQDDHDKSWNHAKKKPYNRVKTSPNGVTNISPPT